MAAVDVTTAVSVGMDVAQSVYGFGEAVSSFASMIGAASVLCGVEERDYLALQVLVDKWIAKLTPLSYIEGLVEEVACSIKRKLWEAVADLGEDRLTEILEDAVAARYMLRTAQPPSVLRLAERVLQVDALDLVEAICGAVKPGSIIESIVYGPHSSPEAALMDIITLEALLVSLSARP